jgi:ABC-2 type transport system ATP-binding protein
VSLFGDRLHVITDDDVATGTRRTVDSLKEIGVTVRDSYEEKYSLEDVFIVVVEKARQQGKVAAEE